MNIKYVTGDATLPEGDGRKIIAHVCNDGPAWGAGFVLALSARDKTPEEFYRRWAKGLIVDYSGYYNTSVPFHLGEIQIAPFDAAHQPLTWVCNMIAQMWVSPGEREFGIPLRYWALKLCLAKLNRQAKFGMASVHMPRIGCGLAGGEWSRVEEIIANTLVDVPVTVYDLPSPSAPEPKSIEYDFQDKLSPRDSEYFKDKDSTY
jgi:O-acetyl-ADP-ribose deacetylase (regulator of RNase III)